MRFYGNARLREGPWRTEFAAYRLEVVASPVCLEEATGGLENPAGRRPSPLGEVAGDNTRFSGSARVEGLGHRSEIFAQAAALASRDSQDPLERFLVKAPHLSRGRGGGKRAACGR